MEHKIKTEDEVLRNAQSSIDKYLTMLDSERKKLVRTLIAEAYIEGKFAGGDDIMKIYNKNYEKS